MPTFRELFQLYYERHAKLRTKCPENARYYFQRHGSFWASTPVSEMTRAALQDWVDSVAVERGQQAANRAIDLTAAIISWGIKREYMPGPNPCKGVDRFSKPSRERFLMPHELERFKNALDQETPVLRDFFWLGLLTAARKSNVLAMRWEDVDISLGIWRIPAAQHKNGQSHHVALSVAALAILQRRTAASGSSPWVFPSTGVTGHVVEPKRGWKRILKRAGLEGLNIHDLRRTVGSYLAISGADGFLIAKALGHKDLRSTAIYARMNLEPVRKALEAVQSKYLSTGVEP